MAIFGSPSSALSRRKAQCNWFDVPSQRYKYGVCAFCSETAGIRLVCRCATLALRSEEHVWGHAEVVPGPSHRGDEVIARVLLIIQRN
jgi:hypothetical protein